jgi:hypothetical protein
MNCQVRARVILRRNCFGVVGPKRVKVATAGSPDTRTALAACPTMRVLSRIGLLFSTNLPAVGQSADRKAALYRSRALTGSGVAQSLAVVSVLIEAIRRPSGLTAIPSTPPVWPRSVKTSSPVTASQSLMV